MSDIAIRVDNLSKEYKIGTAKYRHDSLQDHLAEWARSLFVRNSPRLPKSADRVAPSASRPSPKGYIWALKDVSFEVKQGEVVGIIGRNGAGKSTLLKILSRITEPTGGFVEMRGRVGSLLEVGTGFHRDLTGRENIYLNGAILGMKKVEIDRKFDEIVDFAEIAKFLDTPVKRYSSGMYVRLAFAVAAHLEPDILIVDEVLAVGDAAFQQKCLGKLQNVAKEGRTVLFVSHSLAVVEHICRKGLVLQGGTLAFDGTSKEATDYYLRGLSVGRQPSTSSTIDLRNATGRPKACRPLLKRLELFGDEGALADGALKIGAYFKACIHIELDKPTASLDAGLGFDNLLGQRVFTTHTLFQPDWKREERVGEQMFVCEVPSLTLVPGEYKIKVALDIDGVEVDYVEDAARLTIVESNYYGTGKVPWNGVFVLQQRWQLK
jgi:lipopolysaccharide transport system ATP-binding protein